MTRPPNGVLFNITDAGGEFGKDGNIFIWWQFVGNDKKAGDGSNVYEAGTVHKISPIV